MCDVEAAGTIPGAAEADADAGSLPIDTFRLSISRAFAAGLVTGTFWRTAGGATDDCTKPPPLPLPLSPLLLTTAPLTLVATTGTDPATVSQ